MASAQCRDSIKQDSAICFHHGKIKAKANWQWGCDRLRKHDGGGESEESWVKWLLNPLTLNLTSVSSWPSSSEWIKSTRFLNVCQFQPFYARALRFCLTVLHRTPSVTESLRNVLFPYKQWWQRTLQLRYLQGEAGFSASARLLKSELFGLQPHLLLTFQSASNQMSVDCAD